MEPARKKSKWDDLDHSEAELKTKVKKQKKVKSVPLPVASTSNVPVERIPTGLQGCRSVYNYERLNHIEEGSYGVVSRARDKETGEMFVRSSRAKSLNASAVSP
jgi:cell division cycle 2-like protein